MAAKKKKSMKLGGGGRFQKLEKQVEAKGKSKDEAKAIAAKVGREKYGDKKMAAMASKGKKKARNKGRH